MEREFTYDPRNLWISHPARTALPDSAFRVRWNAHTVPRRLAPAQDVDVRVSLTNTSDQPWPGPVTADPVARDGSYAVRLAYQWTRAGAIPHSKPSERVDFPSSLAPGAASTLLINIKAPAEPGDYELVFELVQERVAWFDAKGAEKLIVPVHVTGGS